MRFVFLFWVLCGLAACKPKVKSESDKLYEQYNAYQKIYEGYQKIPLDSTVAQAQDFLKSFPEDARAWSFYARLKYDQNLFEEAKAAYRKTIALNQRYTVGYAGLGSIFNKQNLNDSAALYLNKAFALGDSSAYTFLNLSFLNIKQAHVSAAIAFADSALLTGDSSALLYAGVSFVNKQLKRENESRFFYTMAKDLGLQDTALFIQVLDGTVPLDSFYSKQNF
jgi:tetratricopeptide (TPR) repeat protein